jgi:DNA-directed RNA polymerase specialized sigma24 family protein
VGEPLQEAFEEQCGRLVGLCFLLTGSRDTAEDLAQEAFVGLTPKIDRL